MIDALEQPAEGVVCRPVAQKALLVGVQSEPETAIARILTESHWSVRFALDSKDAVHQSRQEPWDLIVLDIDGVDKFAPALVSELRNAQPNGTTTTILALCTYVLLQFRERLLESGVQEFLHHPVSAEKLAALLEGIPGS